MLAESWAGEGESKGFSGRLPWPHGGIALGALKKAPAPAVLTSEFQNDSRGCLDVQLGLKTPP